MKNCGKLRRSILTTGSVPQGCCSGLKVGQHTAKVNATSRSCWGFPPARRIEDTGDESLAFRSVATISSACRPSRVSIMISSSAPLAGTSRNIRRCETSRMLAPSCPRMVAILPRTPGRSSIWIRRLTMRMLALELAIDHRGEDPRVDIAAAQDEPDLAAAEMGGVGHHRREPRRAGAFGQRLDLVPDRPSPRARYRSRRRGARRRHSCRQIAMVRSVTFLTAMPSARVEPPQREG